MTPEHAFIAASEAVLALAAGGAVVTMSIVRPR